MVAGTDHKNICITFLVECNTFLRKIKKRKVLKMRFLDELFYGSGIEMFLTVVIPIAIITWLILREVKCWYWKINENIKLQRHILNELRIMNGRKVLNFDNIDMNSYLKSKGVTSDKRVVRDDMADRYYGKENVD
jgi:hypothetical protein